MGNKRFIEDFWVGGESYRLARHGEIHPSEYEPILLPNQQRELLGQIATEPNGMFRICAALMELDGTWASTTWEPYELREQLLQRMQQYGYVFWRRCLDRFVSHGPPQEPEITLPDAPSEKNLDFIEIYLVDPQGEPIPHEMYLVKLPNGQERTGMLDMHGFVRIDGIDPGQCEVSFPNLEANSWRAA